MDIVIERIEKTFSYLLKKSKPNKNYNDEVDKKKRERESELNEN